MLPDLYQLTRDIRNGILSPIDLVDSALQNQSVLEPQQNAFKLITDGLARKSAEAATASFACGSDPGPLAGLPISVKDLYAVTGYPTYAGSQKEVPEIYNQQGPIVDLIRSQLGVITGKTHTVEFAFGGLGVNSHWGTPWNPWDASTHRVSGGSSAGAGVSLIQGSALIALGSDTAGSVRIPASVTGTVGLKTSFGRWSLNGIFPLSQTLDTAGILTRSVADAAFAFAILDPFTHENPWDFVDSLRNANAPRLGTGETALWETSKASISACVLGALKELEQKGARLIEAPLPEAVDAQNLLRKGNVVASEIAERLHSDMPEWLTLLDALVGSRIRDGDDISASEYIGRIRTLKRITDTSSRRFNNCDVMVCPTVPVTPPALDTVLDIESYRPANMSSLHHTCAANSLSLCAITIPAGLDDEGMPVGLQLMAPFNQERNLLATALWIEDCLGNSSQRLGKAPLGVS
ncbi:MAG: aspartyl-tRNA(Asn)/glutamyl-tRNA(Gln) amidotransferase subunit A [Parasphingorhabdus sp.]|jgi:aspartyl-tRNA(Asn)/glutamyl-tRNA(Gln) amidotransferase subunit A